LSGADSFRVRAYTNAVRIFENLDADLEDLVERDALTNIKGVGKSVAALVGEYARTGTAPAYEKLRESVPQGLLDMLRVPGLGPRKITAIRSELQIEDLDALAIACQDGRLDALKGFGKKTQANILKGIEHIRLYQDRSRIDVAWESALPYWRHCAHIQLPYASRWPAPCVAAVKPSRISTSYSALTNHRLSPNYLKPTNQ
jgi:DNA polymerase (family 10)